ncbi:MAG: HAD family hydrolase [Alphaproteobacteria bacterium]|nr:HAD family hydrolase [Alphaproteobacteria bacterium]MBU2378747.1 HAD family hydrolase [Alphaproteobacteria bacterium]
MNPPCIVFDCDGVLLDSNAMKTRTFAAILSEHEPADVQAFLAYQATAFGLSRYRLIDAFFSDFSSREPHPGEAESMLARFGDLCRRDYARQPLTDGAMAALHALQARGVPMFVVSGSDETELNGVLETIGLAKFFRRILGSPKTKLENLRLVERDLGSPHAITFIGDARADWQASTDFGCRFVYLSPWAADRAGMTTLRSAEGFPEISRLDQVLPLLGLAAAPAEAMAS